MPKITYDTLMNEKRIKVILNRYEELKDLVSEKLSVMIEADPIAYEDDYKGVINEILISYNLLDIFLERKYEDGWVSIETAFLNMNNNDLRAEIVKRKEAREKEENNKEAVIKQLIALNKEKEERAKLEELKAKYDRNS